MPILNSATKFTEKFDFRDGQFDKLIEMRRKLDMIEKSDFLQYSLRWHLMKSPELPTQARHSDRSIGGFEKQAEI
jgi:hypothetical protein